MEDFTLGFAMLGILLYYVKISRAQFDDANFDQAAVVVSFI